MKQRNYSRYFRVFMNDTLVSEVRTNDFHPPNLKPFKGNWLIGETGKILSAITSIKYYLPTDGTLYYGYSSQAKAMEMAKAGALKHINVLIDEGKSGEGHLYQYRFNHYEDLTVNLVEGNIQEVEDDAIKEQLAKSGLNQQLS